MIMVSHHRILLFVSAGMLLCVSLADASFFKPRNLAVLRERRPPLHYNHGAGPKLPARLPQSGGAIEELDKESTWDIGDMEAMDFVYLVAYGGFLAAVVLFSRSVTRSGGRAPSWITGLGMEDPYATIALHLAFFGLGLLLRTILPAGFTHFLFSPPSVTLLGTVFPAVESVRAAVTDSGSDDRTWLMYWVIYGIFQYSTEFMDQLAIKYNLVYKYWHTFEVLLVLWLVLPLTDGSTLIYNAFAQPYLVPLVQPIKSYCDGWIATLALTTVNASYLWWFSFIFMSLPVVIKRYAVMGVGSIFPVISTIMALAASKENKEVMRWLTYWPCFSLLFVIMIAVEKFVGSFKGLYVLCMVATLYLMLPMFDGSTLIFREIMVPLLGQRELLLLRDARSLAAQLFKHVPQDRQEEARQNAARAFLQEAKQEEASSAGG